MAGGMRVRGAEDLVTESSAKLLPQAKHTLALSQRQACDVALLVNGGDVPNTALRRKITRKIYKDHKASRMIRDNKI